MASMQQVVDPTEIPEWRAIGRECALVRQLIGSGVTALGQANYADKMGEYAHGAYQEMSGFREQYAHASGRSSLDDGVAESGLGQQVRLRRLWRNSHTQM